MRGPRFARAILLTAVLLPAPAALAQTPPPPSNPWAPAVSPLSDPQLAALAATATARFDASGLDAAVAWLEQEALRAETPARSVAILDLRSRVHMRAADGLIGTRRFPEALARLEAARDLLEEDMDAYAQILLRMAQTYAYLERYGDARGAVLTAMLLKPDNESALSHWAPCLLSGQAFANDINRVPDADTVASWKAFRGCVEPALQWVEREASRTRVPQVWIRAGFIVSLAQFVGDVVDSALARPTTTVSGSIFSAIANELIKEERGALQMLPIPIGMVAPGRAALRAAAAEHWRFANAMLPAMADRERRAFLAETRPDDAERAIGLALHGQGFEEGFASALLTKQLLFDAARQDNAAIKAARAAGTDAWRAAWDTQAGRRRRFAALAVEFMRRRGGANAGTPAELSELHLLAAEIERHERLLVAGNGAYTAARSAEEIAVPRIASGLRPGQVLIEYVRYRPYSFQRDEWRDPEMAAFVLRADGSGTAVGLGPAKTIVREVEAVRRLIDQFAADRMAHNAKPPSPGALRVHEDALARASSALRARVWRPLEAAMGPASRVYVAPDTMLGVVPFETLAVRQGAAWRYLAEDREIVYVGTGRDLTRFVPADPAAPTTGDAVLIGAPRFGPMTAADGRAVTTAASLGVAVGLPMTFDPLDDLEPRIASTRSSLEALGWRVRTITGSEATETAVLGAGSPRLLDVLTHGLALSPLATDAKAWDNPFLRTMLVFAGADRYARGSARAGSSAGLDDGLLTAYEVTNLDLHRTELVNLTACETGLGDVSAEGVASMRQAFLLAGARSVTSSLWSIPREESVQQMETFYKRWLGGTKMPRYAAFRQAQLDALTRARDGLKTSHPYYWGGLVFAGDPGDAPTIAPVPSKAAPAAAPSPTPTVP